MINVFRLFALMTCILVLTGCRSLGPNELTGTHNAYNQAIVNSVDNQMLHNLVRLRYRDNPSFLEINSVTASMELESKVGIDTELSGDSGSDVWMPNLGATYSSGPTISYSPLKGEDFLTNILTPISLESVIVLTQSGWSSGRVFGIAVERINDLKNAPTASGPTPAMAPKDQDQFLQFLELLEAMREEALIHSTINAESGELYILIDPDNGTNRVPEAATFLAILGLDPDVEKFTLDGDVFSQDETSISMRTRSIMSILFYLSQNVQVPEEHKAQGLVTVTRTASGSEYDWSRSAAGARFQVLTSESRPKNTTIAVPYRDHWFYIDESDLDSKSTFMLLSQLFNLQAGAVSHPGPTLTIPVSR